VNPRSGRPTTQYFHIRVIGDACDLRAFRGRLLRLHFRMLNHLARAERPDMFDTFLGGLFLNGPEISEDFSKWRFSAYAYREKDPLQFV
jgi:hypothetical protein